jgi:hypothetical protein
MVMLIGITLLLQAARLLLAGFWIGAGTVLGAVAGCEMMDEVVSKVSVLEFLWFSTKFPVADVVKVQMAALIMAASEVKAQCGVQRLEVIQLVQEDGGVELAIVPGPKTLYRLVYSLPVLMVKQVCDFPRPIHGLELDLDCFRFIS